MDFGARILAPSKDFGSIWRILVPSKDSEASIRPNTSSIPSRLEKRQKNVPVVILGNYLFTEWFWQAFIQPYVTQKRLAALLLGEHWFRLTTKNVVSQSLLISGLRMETTNQYQIFVCSFPGFCNHSRAYYGLPTSVLSQKPVFAPIMSHCSQLDLSIVRHPEERGVSCT